MSFNLILCLAQHSRVQNSLTDIYTIDKIDKVVCLCLGFVQQVIPELFYLRQLGHYMWKSSAVTAVNER